MNHYKDFRKHNTTHCIGVSHDLDINTFCNWLDDLKETHRNGVYVENLRIYFAKGHKNIKLFVGYAKDIFPKAKIQKIFGVVPRDMADIIRFCCDFNSTVTR